MKKRAGRDSVSVYSTEHGRLCPGCGRPKATCACRQEAPAPRAGGPVRVSLDTKGRKGSGVTLITGLPLAEGELRQLASRLKQKCGSGGTVKARTIEIQGDHRDALLKELQALGYQAKRG